MARMHNTETMRTYLEFVETKDSRVNQILQLFQQYVQVGLKAFNSPITLEKLIDINQLLPDDVELQVVAKRRDFVLQVVKVILVADRASSPSTPRSIPYSGWVAVLQVVSVVHSRQAVRAQE